MRTYDVWEVGSVSSAARYDVISRDEHGGNEQVESSHHSTREEAERARDELRAEENTQ